MGRLAVLSFTLTLVLTSTGCSLRFKNDRLMGLLQKARCPTYNWGSLSSDPADLLQRLISDCPVSGLAAGGSGVTFDYTTYGGLSSPDGYTDSGVVGPDGKIYIIPMAGSTAYIIDPIGQTIDQTSLTGINTGSGIAQWEGGVLAPNGKIYGIPGGANAVLILTTGVSPSSDVTTMNGLGNTNPDVKWSGGALAPNGKIYAAPFDSTSVLIIDTLTDTYDTTTIAGFAAGGGKWLGGILAPNGKIYFIPYRCSSILIVDPTTDTADNVTLSALGNAQYDFQGGALGPDGKIYLTPNVGSYLWVLDPLTNQIDKSFYTGTLLAVGGAFAADGYLYTGSWGGSIVSKLDVVNQIVTTIDLGLGSALSMTFPFTGPDQKLYFGQGWSSTRTISVLDVHPNTPFPVSLIEARMFQSSH